MVRFHAVGGSWYLALFCCNDRRRGSRQISSAAAFLVASIACLVTSTCMLSESHSLLSLSETVMEIIFRPRFPSVAIRRKATRMFNYRFRKLVVPPNWNWRARPRVVTFTRGEREELRGGLCVMTIPRRSHANLSTSFVPSN